MEKELCQPSSDSWTERRELVLTRDRHTCQECGSQEDLVVHHINGPSDDPDNLITLCRQCHNPRITSGGRWTDRIRLRISTFEKLRDIKEREGHTSIDSVIKTLLLKAKLEKEQKSEEY